MCPANIVKDHWQVTSMFNIRSNQTELNYYCLYRCKPSDCVSIPCSILVVTMLPRMTTKRKHINCPVQKTDSVNLRLIIAFKKTCDIEGSFHYHFPFMKLYTLVGNLQNVQIHHFLINFIYVSKTSVSFIEPGKIK